MLAELLADLEGCRVRGDERQAVRGLAYHSERVKPGDIFVALKGSRTDGHLYIEVALRGGARVIVTEQEMAPPAGVTVVQVRQARLALAQLSAAFYGHPSREMTLVGITGTNGKTTTAYLLESIFRAAGHRVGVVGTVNYRVGEVTWLAPVTTPESLDLQRLLREMRQLGVSHGVMEVSSHALDLRRVDRTMFTAGVFTNLSQDHLDYHREMKDYFAAKSRLFVEILQDGGPSRGLAVLNLDERRGRELRERVQVPVITYGRRRGGEGRPQRDEFRRDGLRAVLATPAGELEVSSGLCGPFNLANIMAAVATSLGLGVSREAVVKGVAGLAGVPGRLERFGGQGSPTVFVDYAHTPAALEEVIRALRSLGFGRLITVFGCGGDRDRGKRPLMGRAAAAGSHLVVVTSDNPRTEEPGRIIADIEAGLEVAGCCQLTEVAARRGERGYLVIPDRREAINQAVRLARPEDAVLVAGEGHEDYQIWGERRLPFDDREEVVKALERYGS